MKRNFPARPGPTLGASSRESALKRVVADIDGPTLIYCKSPAQANSVVRLLTEARPDGKSDRVLEDAAAWIREAFHPEWSVGEGIRRGIGIHHGRAPRALAHLNVSLFNKRKLDYLVCTSSLIEGVNTAAKNVIIFEGKIAQSRLDFFTFRNIQGRSGRMFQHFIGRVFLFDEPPPHQLQIVDIPLFTQNDHTPLELIMQMDNDDLSDTSRARIRGFETNSELPMHIVRENPGVDPQIQSETATFIRENADELHSSLSWRGLPKWNQLTSTCVIILQQMQAPKSKGVSTGQQLAFRLSQLRRSPAPQDLIIEFLNDQLLDFTVDEAVETAFLFQRQWASFYFPKYLRALDTIQRFVFSELNLSSGDYSVYGTMVENLFMPPEVPAMEEYGLPVQIAAKVSDLLVLGAGLDQALASLRNLDPINVDLSNFEWSILQEVQSAL